MGLSNLRQALENEHAVLRGELKAAESELREIYKHYERLDEVHHRTCELRSLVSAAEALLRYRDPDWQPTLLKPRRKKQWSGPFKPGDRGRMALEVLRESGGWLRPYEIAVKLLEEVGHDPDDRITRQKLANSVGAYLKSHEGDLVESRGTFAKEWRVIR